MTPDDLTPPGKDLYDGGSVPPPGAVFPRSGIGSPAWHCSLLLLPAFHLRVPAPEVPYRGRPRSSPPLSRYRCAGRLRSASGSRVLSRAGTGLQRICRSWGLFRAGAGGMPHPRISSGTSSTAAATHRKLDPSRAAPGRCRGGQSGDGLTLNPEVPHGAPRGPEPELAKDTGCKGRCTDACKGPGMICRDPGWGAVDAERPFGTDGTGPWPDRSRGSQSMSRALFPGTSPRPVHGRPAPLQQGPGPSAFPGSRRSPGHCGPAAELPLHGPRPDADRVMMELRAPYMDPVQLLPYGPDPFQDHRWDQPERNAILGIGRSPRHQEYPRYESTVMYRSISSSHFLSHSIFFLIRSR